MAGGLSDLSGPSDVPVPPGGDPGGDDAARDRLARRMVSVLPRYGTWAGAIRDFETPYGKVGLRQLAVLWSIRHGALPPGGASAAALAELYRVQPSVLTGALARLEAGGFVARETDPHDTRRALVTITERGLAVSRFVEQLFVSDLADSLGGLDGARLAGLADAVELLGDVVADLERKLGQERKPPRRRRPAPRATRPARAGEDGASEPAAADGSAAGATPGG